MKKKGFTISELLAVLVLLGIILTLAGVTINNIRSNTLKKEYENLISTVEVAAEKFAADTGVTQVILETLIVEGLVPVDDEKGYVYNPSTDEILNCYVINIEDGKAEMTTEKTVIEGTEECSTEIADSQAVKIYWSSQDSEQLNEIPKDEWLRGEIDLRVMLYPDGDDTHPAITLKDEDVTWISPYSPDEVSTGVTYSIAGSDTINDTFEVTINYDGKQYTKKQHIRIDNGRPMVYSVLLADPESWNPEKTISFKLSDSASGLQGYQVTETATYDPNGFTPVDKVGAKELTMSYTKDFSTQETASMYIWVKDIAGNVNELSSGDEGPGDVNIQIDNIDNQGADSISMTYAPTAYSQTVTLTGTALDEKSGLVGYAFSSSNPCTVNGKKGNAPATFTSFTKTNNSVTYTHVVSSNGTYYFWVKDHVGNTSCASQTINNIDRNIDSVVLKNPTTANTITINLQVSGTDTKSGIAGWQVTTTNSKPSASSSWNTTGIAADKKSFSSTYIIRSNGSYYLWVKDIAGNIEGGNSKNSGGSTGGITISNIDNEGPVYSSGGSVSAGKVTRTYWTDKTTPVSTYYYVSTTRSTPSAYASGWVYSSGAYSYSYSSACGTYYYVYVKAVDALGNFTVRYLNYYYTGDCCDPAVYEGRYCDYPGYYIYEYYNECTNRYYEEESTTGCYYEDCGSYGSCQEEGRKYKYCDVYYKGRYQSEEEYSTRCTYSGGSSSGGSSGGSSSGSSSSDDDDVRYEANRLCTTKSTCTANGYYGGGQCSSFDLSDPYYKNHICTTEGWTSGSGYLCYCCNTEDYKGNRIKWNDRGSCVGY